MVAPVDAVLPQILLRLKALIAFEIDDIGTVTHADVHELPFITVENELAGVADRHKLHDRGIEEDRTQEMIRRIHAAPEVGSERFDGIVQSYRDDARLAELAVIELGERRASGNQEGRPSAVNITQPQGMMILGEQQRCWLQEIVLELTIPFVSGPAPGGDVLVILIPRLAGRTFTQATARNGRLLELVFNNRLLHT